MTSPWFQLPEPAMCGWKKPAHNTSQNSTAIIGAGIAGLCSARALLKIGYPVTVYEAASDCAAGASASPAGIIKPYVTRQPSDAMRFYSEAYKTLFQLLPELDNGGGLVPCGALQLINGSFPDNPDIYDCLSASESSELAGVELKQNALSFKRAGWLSVREFCHALLNDVKRLGGHFVTEHRLQTLHFDAEKSAWDLTFNSGQGPVSSAASSPMNGTVDGSVSSPLTNSVKHSHKTVLLACGAALSCNKFLSDAALIPARGQLTEFPRPFSLNTVVSGNQYAIPTSSKTLWVGATFDRENGDARWQATDDAKNEASANTLLPALASPIGNPLNRFAAVRATTIDRLPILGPVPDTEAALRHYGDLHHGRSESQYLPPHFHKGLAVVGGLGSRGIALAPFAAELFTLWLSGGPELQQQNRLISPLRFLIRQLKRQ